MTVNPKLQQPDPDRRVWDAIGDLRRQADALRRAQTSTIQRASAYVVGPAGPYTGTNVLATLTFNLPDVNSRVFFIPWINATMSNNTSTYTMTLKDDVDQTTPWALATVVNVATAQNYVPVSAPSSPLAFYVTAESGVNIPTPGDHTFSLGIARTAGTATLTVNNLRFYGFVL